MVRLVDDSEHIYSWLWTRGNELVGRTHSPLAVRLKKNKSTHTAWLTFTDAQVRLEIKKLPREAPLDTSPDLFRICRDVIATNPALADNMPRFLGHSPARRHVAMEFIPGNNLERLLMSALRQPATCDGTLTRAVSAAGRVLAALHNIHSDQVGLTRAQRSIASFLDGMRTTVSALRARRLLGESAERLISFASVIAQPILGHAGAYLLPTDAQPKNILVPLESPVRFIDLDFTAGPRGLGVAFFLVSLDRIALRAIWPRAVENVDNWKRSFVESYLEVSGHEVAREILFFYPWMLVQVMSDHLRRRPLLCWALAARYSRPLHHFVRHVSRLDGRKLVVACSPGQQAIWPAASLFSHASSWLATLDSCITRSATSA
jgi:hypothetical protein